MKKIAILFLPLLLLTGCNPNESKSELQGKEFLIQWIKSFDGTPSGFHDDFEWAYFSTWKNSTGDTEMYKLSYYESSSAFGLSLRTYFGYSPVIVTVTFYWGDFANGDFRGAMYNSLSDPACHQVKVNNITLEQYPSFKYEGYTVTHYDDGAPLKNVSDLVALRTYIEIQNAVDIYYEAMSGRSDLSLW